MQERAVRSFVADTLRVVLSDGEPPCHGLGRRHRTFVGSVYGNALAYALRAQGLGPVRRVGGS